MQISETLPQFLDEKALIVVTAKEHGVIYRAHQGFIETVEKVEEPPLGFSDREGFFFKTGFGKGFGSTAPVEEDDEHDLKRYIKTIADELNAVIKHEEPRLLYLFEPEHLKGRLEAELQDFPHLLVHKVRYGNHVDDHPKQLLEHIQAYIEANEPDTESDLFKHKEH